MIFDGVIVKQGSNVQNLVLASGSAFPSTANDGELFYINSTGGGHSLGLFLYEAASSSWIRQLTTLDSISSLLPAIITPGTYNSITVGANGLVTAGTNVAGITSVAGTANQVTATTVGGAVTLSLPTTINVNTTGTAANITGTYSGSLTSLQITNALGFTPISSAQTISIAGDASGSGTTSITLTLDNVNSNIGSFGSTTTVPVITVNAKGLVTAVSTATIAASGTISSVLGTTKQITATTSGSTITLSLPSNIVVPTASSGTALSLTSTGALPLGINITSGASTAISVTGQAASNLSILTFQQSGQSTLLLYNPASTNNINLYNSVQGDIVSFLGTGGAIITAPSTGTTLQLNTSNATYSASATSSSTLILANSSSSGQSIIDFTIAGTLSGRLRSDYAGDLTYVTCLSGNHSFYVGGDYTVGTQIATIRSNGVQVTSLGVGEAPSGTGNIYASGGMAIGGGATFGSVIARSNTTAGYLYGNYSSVENGQTAGAIYSIGGSYLPSGSGANPLGSMYGIGYTTSSAVSGGSGTQTIAAYLNAPASNWGMYVASDGIANIFLDSDNGIVYGSGLTVSGAIVAGGDIHGHDLYAARSATSGALYLGSNGSHYLYFDGTNYNLPSGGLVLGGGLVASGNVTAFSDARLKDDIQEIKDAVGKLKKIRGVTFNRKDLNVRQTGVIAQELKTILPEAVEEGEYLSVAYGNMAGIFVEAIKELSAEITQLKTRIFELEGRLT